MRFCPRLLFRERLRSGYLAGIFVHVLEVVRDNLSLTNTFYPRCNLGHVGDLERYQEDLEAIGVQVGAIWGHAGAIIGLSWEDLDATWVLIRAC